MMTIGPLFNALGLEAAFPTATFALDVAGSLAEAGVLADASSDNVTNKCQALIGQSDAEALAINAARFAAALPHHSPLAKLKARFAPEREYVI